MYAGWWWICFFLLRLFVSALCRRETRRLYLCVVGCTICRSRVVVVVVVDAISYKMAQNSSCHDSVFVPVVVQKENNRKRR
jgi:hypothetical protein